MGKLQSVFNTETGKWEVIDLEVYVGEHSGGGFIISTTEPDDPNKLWIDPSDQTIDTSLINGDTEEF